jgi:hypothetical protein
MSDIKLASERFPVPIVKTALERETDAVVVELRKRMAQSGDLGLPALLEQRRQNYAIPNGAFKSQAVYDRILLWQIPLNEGEKFGDTMIIMPDSAKTRAVESAPRGVVVSAGLLALDQIRSNGIDVGHIVNIICQAPFRIEIEQICGRPFYLLILRAGDLIGSEDLMEDLRSGKCSVSYEEGQHVLKDKEGKAWNPQLPWIGEGY